MDEDAANYSAEIHILAANQLITETYTWLKKRTDGTAGPKSGNRWPVPEGKNGLWFLVTEDEEGDPVYTYDDDAVKGKTFTYGACFEMNATSDERLMTFSGQVSETTITYPLREDLNYVGNPFPVTYKLQDIQMDEDAANYSGEIHVLAANQLITETYTWLKKRTDGTAGPKTGNRWPVPEGKNGLWFLVTEDEEGDPVYTYDDDAVKNKTFAAGEGIELNSTSDERTVSFNAPYDL